MRTLFPRNPNTTSDTPQGNAVTTSATLRDLLVVTYAVSADMVRPHLPEGLRPDLLPGPEGETLAFLQTVCAYYEDARWSPLPGKAGTSYHQVSYRILTRREGKRGAFVLRTFMSDSGLHFSRRAIEQSADHGRFTIYVDGDPARATYRHYSLRVTADQGKTELEVDALSEPPPTPVPFTSSQDMGQFLLLREELFFRASVPKNAVGLSPVRYGPLLLRHAAVTSARLTPWTDPGLLTEDALNRPLAALLLPEMTLVSSPPRLAKFPAGAGGRASGSASARQAEE